MECSGCGSPTAKLHTRMLGGIEKQVCLCDTCYEKMYAMAGTSQMPQLFSRSRSSQKKSVVCSSCGMTLSTFLKSGLLGCAGCYSAFRGEVDASIKYCQRNSLHRGKRPVASSELKYDLVREQEAFRSQLDAAVMSGNRALAQELMQHLKQIQKRISREEAVQEELRTEAARLATTEEDD